MTGSSLLVTVTGRDGPGIAGRVFAALAPLRVEVCDVEQVHVRGELLLCLELAGDLAQDATRIRAALERAIDPETLAVTITQLLTSAESTEGPRHLVTVLGARLGAEVLAGIFGGVATSGANVERIVRLAHYPVTTYELVVSGGDAEALRRVVSSEAARLKVDVAVQRAGLHRRAKHLIVMDVDSTLLQGEVIDMLAERADRGSEVQALTEAAMAGTMDFSESLTERLSLLAGLDAAVLDEIAEQLVLTPGARTLIRTLKRLGYATAVVSGGFTRVIEPLATRLGIDHVAANTLEVIDGRLSGRLVGPVIDRAGKAAALRRFAGLAGVSMAQTIAVGDGANDLDMLSAAGLGIAFNAKPAVRDVADASLNVPYLDAILFLLGISRREIEVADMEPPD